MVCGGVCAESSQSSQSVSGRGRQQATTAAHPLSPAHSAGTASRPARQPATHPTHSPRPQAVNALGLRLAVGAGQRHDAGVHLHGAHTTRQGQGQRGTTPLGADGSMQNPASAWAVQGRVEAGGPTARSALLPPSDARQAGEEGRRSAAVAHTRSTAAAHLDAGDQVLALQHLDKGRAVAGVLEQRLLVQDLCSGGGGGAGRGGGAVVVR